MSAEHVESASNEVIIHDRRRQPQRHNRSTSSWTTKGSEDDEIIAFDLAREWKASPLVMVDPAIDVFPLRRISRHGRKIDEGVILQLRTTGTAKERCPSWSADGSTRNHPRGLVSVGEHPDQRRAARRLTFADLFRCVWLSGRSLPSLAVRVVDERRRASPITERRAVLTDSDVGNAAATSESRTTATTLPFKRSA